MIEKIFLRSLYIVARERCQPITNSSYCASNFIKILNDFFLEHDQSLHKLDNDVVVRHTLSSFIYWIVVHIKNFLISFLWIMYDHGIHSFFDFIHFGSHLFFENRRSHLNTFGTFSLQIRGRWRSHIFFLSLLLSLLLSSWLSYCLICRHFLVRFSCRLSHWFLFSSRSLFFRQKCLENILQIRYHQSAFILFLRCMLMENTD